MRPMNYMCFTLGIVYSYNKPTFNIKFCRQNQCERGLTFMSKKFTVGDTYSFSKTVSNEDVIDFARITGDKNPLHLDEEYAKKTMFGKRIAHGMISAGIISGAIGMGMPGQGTTYLGQDLHFKKAVGIGDTITVKLTVKEIIPKSKFDIMKIDTVCVNQDGDIVVDGEAAVIPPKAE